MDKIITEPNEWISVAYRDGIWIGMREDGSYISTRGDTDNWEWKPATEEEIKAFNRVDIEEGDTIHANI